MGLTTCCMYVGMVSLLGCGGLRSKWDDMMQNGSTGLVFVVLLNLICMCGLLSCGVECSTVTSYWEGTLGRSRVERVSC